MALTAYSGLPPTLLTSPVTGDMYPTAATSVVTSPLQASFSPNDHIILMVNADGGVDPTGIALSVGGLTFTKLYGGQGISFWVLKNTTANVYYGVTATITWASATIGIYQMVGITNTTGYVYGAGANAAAVAVNAAFGTPTASTIAASDNNNLAIGLVGARKTGSVTTVPTVSIFSAGPGSIGAYQSHYTGVGSGVGKVLSFCASLNEFSINSTTYNYQLTLKDSSATTTNTAGMMILFLPAQISLDDNSYKFDTGPLLNYGNSGTFFDVDSVTGLSDLTITNSSDAVDGADGSYVSARYAQGKTIVISGTAYSSAAPFDEGVIDALKKVLQPQYGGNGIPLYYKPTGQAPRFIMVFPVSFVCDIDRARALGRAPFQIQCLSQTAYLEDLQAKAVDGVTTPNMVMGGNTDTYSTIYFATNGGAMPSFQAKNLTWIAAQRPFYPVGIQNTLTVQPFAGLYKLDMKNRILYKADATSGGWIDTSKYLAFRVWWNLISGQTNAISFGNVSLFDALIVHGARNAWR